jgi:7,8-dihydropterin-6-yl-methyl-4-(beta-D-ribofuranosyl)aminobenzene 5'-phosphate synthase
MRITSLIDNQCSPGRSDLKPEHGFSIWIENGERALLFDTGETGLLAENARFLRINLDLASLAVISHHHSDHAGGLSTFLEANQHAPVYLRQSQYRDFSLRPWLFGYQPVGIDQSILTRYPGRLIFLEKFTEISPGVFVLTEISSRYPRPKGNRFLFAQAGIHPVVDPFDHELLLVVRQAYGLVVFSGCSHSGVLNMVETVVQRFPGEPILALIGGFHFIGVPWIPFSGESPKSIRKIGQTLLTYPLQRVYSGHCTAKRGYRILKEVMGEKLESFPVGTIIEF